MLELQSFLKAFALIFFIFLISRRETDFLAMLKSILFLSLESLKLFLTFTFGLVLPLHSFSPTSRRSSQSIFDGLLVDMLTKIILSTMRIYFRSGIPTFLQRTQWRGVPGCLGALLWDSLLERRTPAPNIALFFLGFCQIERLL